MDSLAHLACRDVERQALATSVQVDRSQRRAVEPIEQRHDAKIAQCEQRRARDDPTYPPPSRGEGNDVVVPAARPRGRRARRACCPPTWSPRPPQHRCTCAMANAGLDRSDGMYRRHGRSPLTCDLLRIRLIVPGCGFAVRRPAGDDGLPMVRRASGGRGCVAHAVQRLVQVGGRLGDAVERAGYLAPALR